MAKLIILLMFAGVVASLGSALRYMAVDKGTGRRTAKALTVRIAVSVALFALLFVFYALGWIQPHGLTPN